MLYTAIRTLIVKASSFQGGFGVLDLHMHAYVFVQVYTRVRCVVLCCVVLCCGVCVCVCGGGGVRRARACVCVL